MTDTDKEIIAKNKIAYKIIAFSLGFSTFSTLSMQYFFKDVLKLDPVALAEFNTIVSFIWLFKPIYGFIVDSFPIFGSKRTSYLLLFSAL